MIDKELELYYRNIRDMFGTDGWKQLMEDLKSNAMVDQLSRSCKR